ncbi:7-cyano-7-deazaguanine synthase QueC [Roseomonas sp. CCTCC AB2023176]|uniref:7-cyano-7-deazaguanine synthase QueC n=1 Tax=Roseomonas sp. CCTCC AB2023176 TaxID=3342640 RepID=UPI0035D8F548
MPETDGALILFSGGQDSTTCLAWALDRFPRVETLGFDYGQRHAVELDCRATLRDRMAAMKPDWAPRLGPDHTLRLDALSQIGGTALTEEAEIALRTDGLPNTFVPGRNLAFLVLAAALATRRALRHVVGGMCETDFSGYPDCRDDTVKAMQVALNLGMATRLVLHTPLMWLDKAQTWRLAEQLGERPLVDLIVGDTHTCYRGARGARHAWGHGCGTCPACDLRRRGWEAYAAGRADLTA